jgi:hypothetical protein
MSADIQTALLTRSKIKWLLGTRELSKHYERKMCANLNKKLRIWGELERLLLEARGLLAATISSSSVTACRSGIGHCPHRGTVRSSIADARVASGETKSKIMNLNYTRRGMPQPRLEPGISDSKGRISLVTFCD